MTIGIIGRLFLAAVSFGFFVAACCVNVEAKGKGTAWVFPVALLGGWTISAVVAVIAAVGRAPW